MVLLLVKKISDIQQKSTNLDLTYSPLSDWFYIGSAIMTKGRDTHSDFDIAIGD